MRTLTAVFCALALAATGVQAQKVKDFLAAVTPKWTAPFEPFQLIGNISYVGTDGIAVYIIKTSQGLILMDTALPESTGMIKANIAKLGFKLGDIKYIVNSHAHFDHTGGFAEMKKDTGAQLVAGERDKPLLEGGYYPGDEKDTDLAFPAVKVDRAVKEGDTVTLGDTTLTAHSMPGHSPGCTSWEMTVKDGGQDRDVLFFCSGTVALNKLVGEPTYPGIVEDYRSTFAKAKAMNPDVLLGPHPEVYGMQAKRAQMKDGAPNPFVKPGELAIYVAGLEQDFDKQLAKQTAALGQGGSLQVPAKSVAVPSTVSPQLAKIVGMPLRNGWDVLPKTGEEWVPVVQATAAATLKNLPGMQERLHVKVEKTLIDGVRAFIVTPETMPPQNQNRILLHMHGGCYVLNPGEAALPEALFMAGFGGFKVISVDYRMPPEAYFPAALDDGMTVYKSLLKTTSPDKIAVFGSSAGGALTLEMMLKAKQDGLPMPGAIAPGTPMSDVTKVGDTFVTNAKLDNVLVSPDGFCDAGTVVYAKGHDLKDPLLSPVYGDMSGFPPTILTSGTRDLLLSNTVRVHRKLRAARVEAQLQVFEAQSHAQYYRDDTSPEAKDAFEEIALFFDRHLAK